METKGFGFLSFELKKRSSSPKIAARDNDIIKTPKSLAKEELLRTFVKKPKPKVASNKKAKTKKIILKTPAFFKNGHLEKLIALDIFDWETFNNMGLKSGVFLMAKIAG